MSIFKKLIATIGHAFGFYRQARPDHIPKKLSQQALEQAIFEAKILHTKHHIVVSELSPGELPSLPKRADIP